MSFETAQKALELKDRALSSTAEGVTISDCSLPDNPIIYANEGFERITGYSIAEVVGRNCRFLQGEDTDPEAIEEIRRALRENRELTVEILNYRKDGTPFWNRLTIDPVRDAEGRVTNYIGIQVDVTERRMAEEALQRAKEELESANDRMQRDLQAAARVQQALLPSEFLGVPGAEHRLAAESVFRACRRFSQLLPAGEEPVGPLPVGCQRPRSGGGTAFGHRQSDALGNISSIGSLRCCRRARGSEPRLTVWSRGKTQ